MKTHGIVTLLEDANVPKKFRPKPLPERPHWLPGMPLLDAHDCPACGDWEAFDVNTGLCKRCHGCFRLIMAARNK